MIRYARFLSVALAAAFPAASGGCCRLAAHWRGDGYANRDRRRRADRRAGHGESAGNHGLGRPRAPTAEARCVIVGSTPGPLYNGGVLSPRRRSAQAEKTYMHKTLSWTLLGLFFLSALTMTPGFAQVPGRTDTSSSPHAGSSSLQAQA